MNLRKQRKTFRLLIFGAAFLVTLQQIQAQDQPPGFKNWASLAVKVRTSDKLTISYSHLTGMSTNVGLNNQSYALYFIQGNLGFNLRTGKKTDIQLGYKANILGLSAVSTTNLYNRFYVQGTGRANIFNMLSKHTFTMEWHFPQLRKYRYRAIYTFRYFIDNDFLPWKMKPYIKAQLYYYLDGKSISYYDDTGKKLASRSPNDLHRYRFGAGLYMKPLKQLRMSVYYLWQQEFNTFLTRNRDLNVPSKSGKSIKAPFNNYSVLGISLTWKINAYNNIDYAKKGH